MVKKKWPIASIMHDWQAGATSTHLCKIYGFSSARACRDRIAKWRKLHWPFELHKPGCPRIHPIKQSEEITEGCIRQGGEEK